VFSLDEIVERYPVLKLGSIGTERERVVVEGVAEDRESRRRSEDAVLLRLSIARFYYESGQDVEAAYQISKAAKFMVYWDDASIMMAELKVLSGIEFEKNAHGDRRLLQNACYDYLHAAEAYFKCGKTELGQEAFTKFLDIADKIRFSRRRVWKALANIGKSYPEGIEQYETIVQSWEKR